MNAEYIRLCSIPAVQEKIIKKLQWIEDSDLLVVKGKPDPFYFCSQTQMSKREIQYNEGGIYIRLPQVHDLQDEKRGLWGMVNGDKRVTGTEFGVLVELFNKDDTSTLDYSASTLEIALLRALMHQWGIEVPS